MENQVMASIPPTQVSADISPIGMIMAAVNGQADLDKVAKLLEIQERWEANEARKAYHRAMSAFKQNPPVIDKNKKVAYGNTKYNHASLDNVVAKITAELSKHGLSASWTTHQNGVISVTCRITHELGHSEETTLTASADKTGAKNDIQALGSTISYLQRYSILSVCGLATTDCPIDTDGITSKDNITADQLVTIRNLLKENNRPEAKLAEFLKVDKLEDARSVDYEKAIKAISAVKPKETK